jgi:hypothetical protein
MNPIGSITNFPNGFANGLSVRGMPLLQMQPGVVFWVDNSTSLLPQQRGASDGNRGTFLDPFATLDFAISSCVAGRGDIIFVGAGHAETISTATALSLDVKGVAVIGLGGGSSRPTFTLGAANTTTIPVSTDDISVQNCIFVANFLTIAACFTLTLAKNFAVQNCEFRDTAANKNFANVVQSTGAANTADGLMFTDNFYPSIGTTFNTTVLVADAIDRMNLSRNNIFTISTQDIAILAVSTTGAVTNLLVQDNNVTHTSSLLILGTGTAGTGLIQRNFAASLDAAAGVLFIVTIGWRSQGNSISGALAGQGFPIPALDT